MSFMDITATLDVSCPTDRIRPWICDLDRYPEWLSIVPTARFSPAALNSGQFLSAQPILEPEK